MNVQCGKFDKYGRLLVDLFDGDLHINQEMIKNGHGYKYIGGTK